MTVVLISRAESAATWAAEIRGQDPELDLRVWPDETRDLDPAAVDFVIAAKPPPGAIAAYPNVKAVLSLWAGVDHITSDPEFPAHLPIARMVEEGLTRGMREFVVAQALNAHLKMPEYIRQQNERVWRPEIRGPHGTEPLVDEVTVGILGLGVLGSDCAAALRDFGFQVAGWAKSRKRMDGVDCYAGDAERAAMLARTDILVNLLPRTAETENVLNAGLFAELPEGAYLINVGRGEHLVEEDLIAALESGRLAGATLDVFRTEPLPQDHPFWAHPKITVTPHVASITRVKTGVARLVSAIRAFERGETPEGVVDPEKGY
ncbi:MAG: glyoxylate/hydroxypyruvate reductase A [Marivibrio sp.]|uniref:2-hydroxyacid dehydrogenase n=1 Tax=Marivibrio sp. TaxID=2039719 RepID=UPI0032EA9447